MYFSSQHNKINIKNIRGLQTQIESIEKELSVALKQLDNQTVLSIENSLFRCTAALQSIHGEITVMANCLQEISDRYETTEAEIIRNVRNLPFGNLFDGSGDVPAMVSESSMIFQTIPLIPTEYRSLSEAIVANTFDWRFKWLRRVDFLKYIEYFPAIFPMIEEIPEQWLQAKLYKWIARKVIL